MAEWRGRSGAHEVGFAVAVLAMLAASLWIDILPRFHLGDSSSYLGTRLWDSLPEDRSWTYGVVASKAVRMTRLLASVPVVQVVAFWLSACVFARALTARFGFGAAWGIPVVAVLVANPLDFYWSRAIMTDEPAASVFLLMVALLLWRPRAVVLLPTLFGLAFALASLRVVYLPPLALGMAVVALAWRRQPGVAWRYAAMTMVLAAAYGGFAVINARVLHRPEISANHAAARFLVSAWSPLMAGPVRALDLPETERARLLEFTYDNRLAHAFVETGIGETLHRRHGSYAAAGADYRRLMRDVVLGDPVGFARLVIRSWSDYVNPELVLMYHHEKRFSGAVDYKMPTELDSRLMGLFREWGVRPEVAPDLARAPSPSLAYFAAAGGYWALLLAIYATAALVVLAALPATVRTPEVVALTVFAFASMALLALTSNELVTRYLIPMAVPLLVTLVAWAGRERRDA